MGLLTWNVVTASGQLLPGDRGEGLSARSPVRLPPSSEVEPGSLPAPGTDKTGTGREAHGHRQRGVLPVAAHPLFSFTTHYSTLTAEGEAVQTGSLPTLDTHVPRLS